MRLLIHQVASLAGVSVRTLHYYDEIGLLRASEISISGYRYYSRSDMEKLKLILYYKEMDFSLKSIKKMVSSSIDDKEILKRQRHLLTLKRDRLNKILGAMDSFLQGEGDMSFTEFDMSEIQETITMYEKEAREKWGDCDEYSESNRRVKNYRKEDWSKIKEEDNAIISTFASLVGTPVGSEKARETIRRWQDHISRYYYNCSDEILLSLGEMYVSDERFLATLDRYKEGTAKYINEAIIEHIKSVKIQG